MVVDVLNVIVVCFYCIGVKFWLKCLYLWLGLSVGLVFVLIVFSGSVFVLQELLLCLVYLELIGYMLFLFMQQVWVLVCIVYEWMLCGLCVVDLFDVVLLVWQLYFDNGMWCYFDLVIGELLLMCDVLCDVLLILCNWYIYLFVGCIGENLFGVFGWIVFGLFVFGFVLWWLVCGCLCVYLCLYVQFFVCCWFIWYCLLGVFIVLLLLLVIFIGILMVYYGVIWCGLEVVFGCGMVVVLLGLVVWCDVFVLWGVLFVVV